MLGKRIRKKNSPYFVGFCFGGVVIPLIFPKVPQSSQTVPQEHPLPLDTHPPADPEKHPGDSPHGSLPEELVAMV